MYSFLDFTYIPYTYIIWPGLDCEFRSEAIYILIWPGGELNNCPSPSLMVTAKMNMSVYRNEIIQLENLFI